MRVPVALPVTVYVLGCAPAVTPFVVPHAASKREHAKAPTPRRVRKNDRRKSDIRLDRELLRYGPNGTSACEFLHRSEESRDTSGSETNGHAGQAPRTFHDRPRRYSDVPAQA